MTASDSTTLWAGASAHVLDDFTGKLPIARVDVALDVQDGASWRAVGASAVATPMGTYTFPGLEKYGDASGRSPRRYRLRVRADGYAPAYLFNSDAVEIDVSPYDEDLAPNPLPAMPTIIALFPTAAYPYGAEVPLLHGTVVDAAGTPVPYALVECLTERVLTDPGGAFTLPMRKSPAGQALIDASDRAGRTGTIPVTVPQGLGHRKTITIA